MRGNHWYTTAAALGAASLCCCLCSCSSSVLSNNASSAPPTAAPANNPQTSGAAKKTSAPKNGPAPTPPGKAPALKNAACPSFAKRMNGFASATTDQQVAKAKAMTPQNVVFMGDSITYALESFNLTKYKQQLGAVEVYAVPADTVDDLAWRLCQAFPPTRTFVIMIGTNNTPAEDPGTKIIDLVKYIRARSPTANIVVLGIFWRADQAALAKCVSANAAVKKYIDGSGDKKLIYSDAGVNLPPNVYPDGLHPNEAGWDVVLDKITPMLSKLK